MLLLNVSDIHFNHPNCNGPMDADKPFRTRLIQDARHRCRTLGNVDAILVSGDIAYKGHGDEYKAAYQWLKELADVCGCPLERLFVIPGNHDVDRNIAGADTAVRNVHSVLASAQSDHREGELRAQFGQFDTGHALLKPITKYNEFAAKFSCQVYPTEKLFWHQDIPLDARTILRIYGLTSTLLSGKGGDNDLKGQLYLSPLQTVLDPLDGVINLVMCHHPPDWLLDHDPVDDAVNGRAMVQFFGHKHRARITRDPQYVRFSAGAVNPDRYEPGWEPGYNLVNLTVTESDGQCYLDIEAHIRIWQTSPEMFIPKIDGLRGAVYRHSMELPNWPAIHKAVAVASVDAASVSSKEAVPTEVAEKETTMGDQDARNVVLRFWDLTSSERREIALQLGLLDQNEVTKLPEPERYGRALNRAGERGLLEQVANEIQKREEE